MSINRPAPDPEMLVRTYLAERGGISPDKIEPEFQVFGFGARSAVLSVGAELHVLGEANRERILKDFEGNERYSVTDCVNYIKGLIKRNE